MISALAWRLQNELRPQDIIARYGGEEFIILFPNTDNNTAIAIIERVKKSISKDPIRTNIGIISLTFSAGVNTTQGDEDISFVEFIDGADKALYKSKDMGRNRITSAIAT